MKRGRFFPIVCASDMAVKDINRTLTTMYTKSAQKPTELDPEATLVITGLGGKFDSPTVQLPGNSIIKSPFKHKTTLEIARMLATLSNAADSDFDPCYFLIFDNRTLSDEVARLVVIDDDISDIDLNVKSILVQLSCAYALLFGVSVAQPDMSDLHEEVAMEADGIIKR